MVKQTEEKWKRRFQEVSDEKEETFKKLAELQEKVRTVSVLAWRSYLLNFCCKALFCLYFLLLLLCFVFFDILLCIRTTCTLCNY